MNTKEELKRQCLSIAKFIEQEDRGKTHDGEEYTAYDYLEEVYRIDYIISSNMFYVGARLLLAGGGPTIILDTEKQLVIGTWADDRVKIPYYNDNLQLDDALEDMAGNLFSLK